MRNFSSQQQMGAMRRSLLMGAGLGLLLAVVFVGGFFVRDLVGLPGEVQAAEGEDYALLNEVQSLLDQRFVRAQSDYTARQYGAIRGMLSTLNDPYTFFIDPPVAASEGDVLAGTYGGIGVQITRNEAGELVLFPFDDSPALTAGILAGDRLIAVNGMPVDITIPQDVLDQMLRGEVVEGSGVAITVLRESDNSEFSTFVPFAVINVPSITWRVLSEDERVGYVQIARFTSRTPDELSTAMTDLRAANVSGLIVDLRDNAGGLLQESITVADQFIDEGVLVYQRNNLGENPFNAASGGVATDLPLVVLVNGRTASGAEIVAGAIQDGGRGILIGENTYGKGTVQEIFVLSDNSSLHVTASEWFTPTHQPLDGAGLQPDVPSVPDANGADVPFAEAVRQLQGQLERAA